MKLRVVPSALSLILSGGIPGLIAVTPAPAAAAKSAYAMTDLGNLGGGVSLGFGINATAINDGQIAASGSNAQARSTCSSPS